jgi:hypothetical protein
MTVYIITVAKLDLKLRGKNRDQMQAKGSFEGKGMDTLQTPARIQDHLPNAPCAFSRPEQRLQCGCFEQALLCAELYARRFASVAARPIPEDQAEKIGVFHDFFWVLSGLLFPLLRLAR